MIVKFFKWRYERLMDVKRVAKEKNLPVWQMPVLDAVGISLLWSIYASYATWSYLNGLTEMGYKVPLWLEDLALFSPLFYFVALFATIMDRLAVAFVHLHALVAKGVMLGLQKADHKIWRKTGKDSVITNKIWWVQQKFLKLKKQRRRQLLAVFVLFMVYYYSLKGLFF